MKKGFTLIELLAVIVILAIIALIATPIVLNIINDAKESAVLRSAEFYVDGVEHSIATAILKNKNITDNTYNIKDGDICLNTGCTDKLEVEVDGKTPEVGTITITNGNITGLNITLEEKEIYKNSKGELVYLKKLNDICKPSKEQKYAANPYDEGYKYECKVDPNKDSYIFYVLNTRNDKGEIITETSTDKTSVSINLIMAQNINSDGTPTTKAIKKLEKDTNGGIYNLVAWVSKEDYNDDVNYGEYGNNNKGPITAMSFLSEATKNWTNTNEMTIDTFTDYAGATHNMKSYNTYARMPYYNEVEDVSTDKMWLIDYLNGEYDEEKGIEGRENRIDDIKGYWELSSDVVDSQYGCVVSFIGIKSKASVYSEVSHGVRPVINLKI